MRGAKSENAKQIDFKFGAYSPVGHHKKTNKFLIKLRKIRLNDFSKGMVVGGMAAVAGFLLSKLTGIL